MTRPCPICKTEVTDDSSRYFPFCSKRCELLDLGNWAKGDYRIPDPTPPSLEELERHDDSLEET